MVPSHTRTACSGKSRTARPSCPMIVSRQENRGMKIRIWRPADASRSSAAIKGRRRLEAEKIMPEGGWEPSSRWISPAPPAGGLRRDGEHGYRRAEAPSARAPPSASSGIAIGNVGGGDRIDENLAAAGRRCRGATPGWSRYRSPCSRDGLHSRCGRPLPCPWQGRCPRPIRWPRASHPTARVRTAFCISSDMRAARNAGVPGNVNRRVQQQHQPIAHETDQGRLMPRDDGAEGLVIFLQQAHDLGGHRFDRQTP